MIKRKCPKCCIFGHICIMIKHDKITVFEVLFYVRKVSNSRGIPKSYYTESGKNVNDLMLTQIDIMSKKML